jgi:hypothetical protein
MEANTDRSGTRRWGSAAALVAGGVVAGGILAGTLSAQAATTPSDTSTSSSTSSSAAGSTRDVTKSMRSDEELLTGDTATKVREAALAKYPGATIQRVETDSDGVYEAHLVTTDGQQISVEVDTSFAVTGNEDNGGGRSHGAPGDDDGTVD